MHALIQHNFVTGMGDFLNCVYEYIITTNKLKKVGYNHFTLCLYLNKNIYIDADIFWDIFNKSEFETLFTVIILNNPITEKQYEIYTYVGTVGVDRPGQHQWDLFLENPTNESRNCFSLYSYRKPESEYLELFNSSFMSKYKQLKQTHNLDDYISIYFRAEDLKDEEDFYLNKINQLEDIIKNKKVFVCSNSYAFKKYMSQYENVIVYDIPMENILGNHYTYGNKLCYDDKKIFNARTEFILFDMLTLSDSSDIYF